jgi:thiamine biosynthesis protein ThiS
MTPPRTLMAEIQVAPCPKRPCFLAEIFAACDNPFGMKLEINGEEKSFDSPLTLAALIEGMGMKLDRVAVELNRDIVPRDRWAETALAEGDKLEIVHFVGGGCNGRFRSLP